MRLNAYLARAGIASRRKADERIKAGRVLVNGEPGQLNTFVEQVDSVQVDGREIALQQLAHLLLYKPVGHVTTACEYLAEAISLPAGSFDSYGALKLLPYWDPLRGDPRFEKIVASLAPKD